MKVKVNYRYAARAASEGKSHPREQGCRLSRTAALDQDSRRALGIPEMIRGHKFEAMRLNDIWNVVTPWGSTRKLLARIGFGLYQAGTQPDDLSN